MSQKKPLQTVRIMSIRYCCCYYCCCCCCCCQCCSSCCCCCCCCCFVVVVGGGGGGGGVVVVAAAAVLLLLLQQLLLLVLLLLLWWVGFLFVYIFYLDLFLFLFYFFQRGKVCYLLSAFRRNVGCTGFQKEDQFTPELVLYVTSVFCQCNIIYSQRNLKSLPNWTRQTSV